MDGTKSGAARAAPATSPPTAMTCIQRLNLAVSGCVKPSGLLALIDSADHVAMQQQFMIHGVQQSQ